MRLFQCNLCSYVYYYLFIPWTQRILNSDYLEGVDELLVTV